MAISADLPTALLHSLRGRLNRRVLGLLSVAWVAAILPGCRTRGYERTAEVHAELLASFARKLCHLARDAPPPGPEAFGEFRYPLERTRAFLEEHRSESGKASHRYLAEVAEIFEATVRKADRARFDAAEWRSASEDVCAKAERIDRAASALRAALEKERDR
ncbi:MAG: hypothetical protein KatS3mg076_1587 [Candidatus Binatia bacterium]|nr:MAG: hypothetical protein KatS3mg076_1587 [Candidatus Binatia bacterium]